MAEIFDYFSGKIHGCILKQSLQRVLAWERLGISQEELESVAGEKEAWGASLAGCQRDPAPDKRKRMDGWIFKQLCGILDTVSPTPLFVSD